MTFDDGTCHTWQRIEKEVKHQGYSTTMCELDSFFATKAGRSRTCILNYLKLFFGAITVPASSDLDQIVHPSSLVLGDGVR